MLFTLVGGFALFALGGKGIDLGGACNTETRAASKKAIATAIGTYVRNHLAKATTWTLAQVIAKVETGYPSGLDSLATQNACKTTLPTSGGNFWKLLATITIGTARNVPPTGNSLSSGALAAMTQMAKDGVKTHFTALALSYPGLSEFELENLAKDYGYTYNKTYTEYGRSYVGTAEDWDIVKKPANVEDYSEIPRDIESL